MDNRQLSDSPAEVQIAYFRIANHLVQIVHDKQIDLIKGLPSFVSFIEDEPRPDEVVLTVELTTELAPQDDPQAKLLSDISVIMDERFRFQETKDRYVTTIKGSLDDHPWKMISTKDFGKSVIYAQAGELYSTFKSSWLIMIAFGQAVLQFNTILLHASVVEKGGRAYAFLGKSGTGKSTHSRLWLKHISGAQLINDDNPAVRVYPDGDVLLYGTPWSGKTPCYRQQEVKLGAVIRLEQAPFNKLHWKQGKEALVALLPSGSAIRWNPALFGNMLATLEAIVRKTPVGLLQCLPNEDAALLSYAEASAYKVGTF